MPSNLSYAPDRAAKTLFFARHAQKAHMTLRNLYLQNLRPLRLANKSMHSKSVYIYTTFSSGVGAILSSIAVFNF